MNENKIKTLLALAQLDASQNQPDPREAMAGQMLMQMLGMNQQQETQASQAELERERLNQALAQFQEGQANALAMNRDDLEMKKLQHQELLNRAERQYGMDMLKEMGANQRAYDEANQKRAFQEENKALALKQIMGGLAQHTTDPTVLKFALEQLGWTGGASPQVGLPAPDKMEAWLKELKKPQPLYTSPEIPASSLTGGVMPFNFVPRK